MPIFEKTIEDPLGTPCIFTVGDTDKPTIFGRTKKVSKDDLVKTKEP